MTCLRLLFFGVIVIVYVLIFPLLLLIHIKVFTLRQPFSVFIPSSRAWDVDKWLVLYNIGVKFHFSLLLNFANVIKGLFSIVNCSFKYSTLKRREMEYTVHIEDNSTRYIGFFIFFGIFGFFGGFF